MPINSIAGLLGPNVVIPAQYKSGMQNALMAGANAFTKSREQAIAEERMRRAQDMQAAQFAEEMALREPLNQAKIEEIQVRTHGAKAQNMHNALLHPGVAAKAAAELELLKKRQKLAEEMEKRRAARGTGTVPPAEVPPLAVGAQAVGPQPGPQMMAPNADDAGRFAFGIPGQEAPAAPAGVPGAPAGVPGITVGQPSKAAGFGDGRDALTTQEKSIMSTQQQVAAELQQARDDYDYSVMIKDAPQSKIALSRMKGLTERQKQLETQLTNAGKVRRAVSIDDEKSLTKFYHKFKYDEFPGYEKKLKNFDMDLRNQRGNMQEYLNLLAKDSTIAGIPSLVTRWGTERGRKAAALISSIVSVESVQGLTNMKDQAGAIGTITEAEWKLFNGQIKDLRDGTLSGPEMAKALQHINYVRTKIRDDYENWVNKVQRPRTKSRKAFASVVEPTEYDPIPPLTLPDSLKEKPAFNPNRFSKVK